MAVTGGTRRIVGGVDTHKDLHVAAVVDEQDRVIGTRSFATSFASVDLQNERLSFGFAILRRYRAIGRVQPTSALPGHISVQIGRPAPSTISARIICFRSGR